MPDSLGLGLRTRLAGSYEIFKVPLCLMLASCARTRSFSGSPWRVLTIAELEMLVFLGIGLHTLGSGNWHVVLSVLKQSTWFVVLATTSFGWNLLRRWRR